MKIAYDGGEVSAVWDGDGRTAIVLAHGAGGNLHTPQLVAVSKNLAGRGFAVLRFNFAYSEAGKRAPDRAPALEACYRAVAAHASERADRVFLGGRSMGGRIASQIVAAGTAADGLIFLAYPLHPPGTPERVRDAHLYDIDVPMLFIQGTRDSFATPELFRRVTSKLKNATVHAIENGDHSHKVPGRTPADVNDEIADAIAEWSLSR